MVSRKNNVCLINKQIHSMKHKLTLVLLSFFLGVQCMVAQQMKVTGVVINEDDGEPVIGASIVVKGTTIGTITDLDGKFELETQKDAKLIISGSSDKCVVFLMHC